MFDQQLEHPTPSIDCAGDENQCRLRLRPLQQGLQFVERPIRAIEDTESPFYLLLEVADRPGVLAAIAGELGQHDVSIKSMEQRGIGADARLIFITHRAREADLRATLDRLRDVESVHRVGSVLRVVGDDE